MLRLCKFLAPRINSCPLSLTKPKHYSFIYGFPQYFSSMHHFTSSRSILSPESMIDNNIIEESTEFLKRLPREDSASFQRIFDKYKSIKELSLLRKEENTSLLNLFNLMGNTYHSEDQNAPLALKYFLQVSDMFESGLVDKTIGFAFNNISLSSVYYQMGDLEKAEEFAQNAITYVPNADESDSFQLLLFDSIAIRARIKLDKGEVDEALKRFEDTIPIIETLPNQKQPTIFRSVYSDMADAYQRKNEIQLAVQSYKQGINKIIEHIGHESIETADLYFQLAQTLATIKELDQALEYAHKAVVVDSKYSGPQSLIAFEVLNIQRFVYYEQADYQKCLKCCKEIIKVMKANPLLDRQHLINTYFTMTAVFLTQKDYLKVQKYYKLALNELEDSWPKDSHELANLYLEYAHVLRIRANPEHMDEVRDLYTKASESSAKLSDVKSEVYAINNLGQIASLTGDHDKSLEHFEQSFAKLTDSEEFQYEAEITHGWLSRLYLRKAKFSQSVQHGIKAIELCEKNKNISKQRDEHYYILGKAYEHCGDFYKAEVLYRELLSLLQEEGKCEKSLPIVLEHIKRVLQRQGKEFETIE